MLSRRLIARYIADQLESGKKVSDVTMQLAAYIVEHRLEKETERIINDIRHELAEKGSSSATVITARPLVAELRKNIEAYIKSDTGATHVTLIERVDPALLGGIVIETPDKRLDASVVSKLKQLRNVS